jgi:hypothetical protein
VVDELLKVAPPTVGDEPKAQFAIHPYLPPGSVVGYCQVPLCGLLQLITVVGVGSMRIRGEITKITIDQPA